MSRGGGDPTTTAIEAILAVAFFFFFLVVGPIGLIFGAIFLFGGAASFPVLAIIIIVGVIVALILNPFGGPPLINVDKNFKDSVQTENDRLKQLSLDPNEIKNSASISVSDIIYQNISNVVKNNNFEKYLNSYNTYDTAVDYMYRSLPYGILSFKVATLGENFYSVSKRTFDPDLNFMNDKVVKIDELINTYYSNTPQTDPIIILDYMITYAKNEYPNTEEYNKFLNIISTAKIKANEGSLKSIEDIIKYMTSSAKSEYPISSEYTKFIRIITAAKTEFETKQLYNNLNNKISASTQISLVFKDIFAEYAIDSGNGSINDKLLQANPSSSIEDIYNNIFSSYQFNINLFKSRFEAFIDINNNSIIGHFPIKGSNYKYPDNTNFINSQTGNYSSFYTDFNKWGYRILADEGTEVIAPENCIVDKIGWNGDFGWSILLKSLDGNRKYFLGNLQGYSSPKISSISYNYKAVYEENIILNTGETLALVGSTGGKEKGMNNGMEPSLSFRAYYKKTEFGNYIEADGFLILKLFEKNKYSN